MKFFNKILSFFSRKTDRAADEMLLRHKNYKIGDVYLVEAGCPQCGSDLEVTHAVSVMCVNWQHPNIPDYYNSGGNRSCDYAIMSG